MNFRIVRVFFVVVRSHLQKKFIEIWSTCNLVVQPFKKKSKNFTVKLYARLWNGHVLSANHCIF